MKLDHFAVAAATLDEGVAFVEAALGVTLPPAIGRHPLMSTHNRLLSLGPEEYLEVIAIDPEAPPPGRARWFGLDGFTGAPRIAAWIVGVEDITAAMPGAGEVLDLARADFRWRMAVPPDGLLPFDGLQPSETQWLSARPAPLLPASGCRLEALVLTHPRADALQTRLAALDDSRISIQAGAAPGISARILTPNGPRILA